LLPQVGWARDFSVPFVAKSGGHSQWSTIGENGVVIDLTKFAGVDVDTVAETATLKGSVLSKDVAVALAAKGFFTGKVYHDMRSTMRPSSSCH
jgi:FAD/FMN-containing dehydrogenase